MRKSKKQVTLSVIHREVNILIVRYRRYCDSDKQIYAGAAVFERCYPDSTESNVYFWQCKFSTGQTEEDLRKNFNVDYPRLMKILDGLYESKNRYTYTAY